MKETLVYIVLYLTFSVLQIGSLSGINAVLVFVVALFFAWVVKQTGSLQKVTLFAFVPISS